MENYGSEKGIILYTGIGGAILFLLTGFGFIFLGLSLSPRDNLFASPYLIWSVTYLVVFFYLLYKRRKPEVEKKISKKIVNLFWSFNSGFVGICLIPSAISYTWSIILGEQKTFVIHLFFDILLIIFIFISILIFALWTNWGEVKKELCSNAKFE